MNRKRPRSARTSRHPLRVLTTRGLAYLSDLGAGEATTVGRHWNAIRRYLDTGYIDDLADFDRIEISGTDENGTPLRATLESDPDVVDRHAIRGDVSFESIYDEVQ